MDNKEIKKITEEVVKEMINLLEIDADFSVEIMDKAEDEEASEESKQSEASKEVKKKTRKTEEAEDSENIENIENSEENEELPTKYIKIQLNGDNLGALIGFRGRNMRSIQYILSLIIRKKLEREYNYRLLLNINNYAEVKEDRIKRIFDSFVEKIKASDDSVEYIDMPSFRPDERRIIHIYSKDIDDIEVESVGEGRDRHIRIFRKK